MATTMTASPLLRTATDFPTDYWNDSCNAAELTYAIENGAVGATTNPTIVGAVMKQEYDIWAPRVREIVAEHPDWTDLQVTWQVIEEMAIRGWKMLEPIYQQHHGQKGRLSIQIDPTLNRSPERMLEQARHFDTLAPNVQIKFPATAAGLEAIEQATYEGMNINATVSFTVSQALAVGAAVERALARREAEGHDTSWMSPICTIMIGRTDDWVKKSCDRDGITIHPAAADWAGIAVFKRAAAIYRGARLPGAPAGGRLSPPPPLVGAHRRRCLHDDPGQLAAAASTPRTWRSGTAGTTRSRRPTSTSSWRASRSSSRPTSPMP